MREEVERVGAQPGEVNRNENVPHAYAMRVPLSFA